MTVSTPFKLLLEEIDTEEQVSSLDDQQPTSLFETLPIVDSEDSEILMHRDAHFSGSFNEMLQYYRKGGKGANAEFEITRIEYLAELELKMQQNLAGLVLSGTDAEHIARAKSAYKKLQEIYDLEEETNMHPRLIADMILSEDTPSIEAIINEGEAIVPSLIHLLNSEQFFDPLFPGYGQAPALAAKCLGEIADERAIVPLFESIGHRDFFTENTILNALQNIGGPAKEFLIARVLSKPLSEDNERAAMILIEFKKDPKLAKTSLKLLQKQEFIKQYPLSNYLVLLCESLTEQTDRETFLNLRNNKDLPKLLQEDMKTVAKSWC